MRFAPAGTSTLALGPTAAMRLPSTTMVPSAMTSSPFIVTMRAPLIAMMPDGVSDVCVKPTRTPSASALGSSLGAPGTNVNALRSSLVNRRSPRPKWTFALSPDQLRYWPASTSSWRTGSASIFAPTAIGFEATGMGVTYAWLRSWNASQWPSGEMA